MLNFSKLPIKLSVSIQAEQERANTLYKDALEKCDRGERVHESA
jgi:hypothetical protein